MKTTTNMYVNKLPYRYPPPFPRHYHRNETHHQHVVEQIPLSLSPPLHIDVPVLQGETLVLPPPFHAITTIIFWNLHLNRQDK